MFSISQHNMKLRQMEKGPSPASAKTEESNREENTALGGEGARWAGVGQSPYLLTLC